MGALLLLLLLLLHLLLAVRSAHNYRTVTLTAPPQDVARRNNHKSIARVQHNKSRSSFLIAFLPNYIYVERRGRTNEGRRGEFFVF